MVMPLLEIRNVETCYGLIYALRGVSFAVENGAITAIRCWKINYIKDSYGIDRGSAG